jgi:hypothetical protein
VPVNAAMAEPARQRDGTSEHSGLGLAVRRYRGLTVLCHSGSQPGYKAHIAYVPERDLGVVILSNREDARPTALATGTMDEAIGSFPASHPAHEVKGRRGTAKAMALVGTYVDVAEGEWVELEVEGDVLRGETLGDPIFLYPERDGVFRHGDDYRAIVPAELSVDVGGATGDVRLVLGGHMLSLRRFDAPSYTQAALAAFAGVYESGEVASRHTVSIAGGTLIVEYGLGCDEGLAFTMEPIAPDVFLVRPTGPGIAYRHVFRFERDAAGTVIAAVVTMERLKRWRLERGAPDVTPPREKEAHGHEDR